MKLDQNYLFIPWLFGGIVGFSASKRNIGKSKEEVEAQTTTNKGNRVYLKYWVEKLDVDAKHGWKMDIEEGWFGYQIDPKNVSSWQIGK